MKQADAAAADREAALAAAAAEQETQLCALRAEAEALRSRLAEVGHLLFKRLPLHLRSRLRSRGTRSPAWSRCT